MSIRPKLSEAVADWLAGDLHDFGSTPFVRDAGRIYLRYDAIKIHMDAEARLSVTVMYNGQERHKYTVPGPFYAGCTADLAGLEGRVELHVNREG